jgi:leader peptidase (prepilin peptidase)/N-methyltransferase
MELFYQTIIFFLGASIASFVNAWAMRLGINESVMNPSRCRACDKTLKFHQLIPVFSWLKQLGHCGCKQQQKISIRYFLTEVLFGLIFLVLFSNMQIFSDKTEFVLYLVFLSMTLHLFLTDMEYQQLYLPMMLTGIGIGLGYGFYQDQLLLQFYGAFLGFILLFATNWLFQFFRKKQGLGDGDKYLLAMMGAWFGPLLVLQSMVLSSWIAIIFMAFLYLKNKTIPTKIAYGPFIILASIFIQSNQLFIIF